jgi:alpha-N-arabinofuranosidase
MQCTGQEKESMHDHPHISRKPLRHPFAAFVLPVFLLFGSVLATSQMTESATSTAPIHIRVFRPAHAQEIPETLFGSFLEPIGHSTYGGLWANVVENSSFEEGLWSPTNVEAMLHERPQLRRASDLGLPLPWEPLDPSQGSRYAPIRGDAANSSQSVLLMGLPGKEVGILQRVYLPVHRQLTYSGSLWLKHLRGPAAVAITLRRHAHPEETLAAATVQAAATDWTKYPFTLTLRAGTLQPLEPVDLVISLSDDARAQVDNISLNPADAIDGMDPDVIALARALHSPIVRFGGNFTSAYDWRDGIGPIDKRVSKLNLSWGIPEYNTFGTDEFLRFCEFLHARPQIALNLGTSTPEQAADWVKYVDNDSPQRHAGNLWELGNELWGTYQIGYPSQQRIAAVTLATSQAVHNADASARLIATGGDQDSFYDWNAQQLTNPPGTFNYLSTHFVVEDKMQLLDPSPDFRSLAVLALPWGLTQRMRSIHQQIVASANKDVQIAFTEWLVISSSHAAPHYSNLGGALFAAGFLNMLMRNSDIISIADMTGIVEFGGIWQKRGQVYPAPAYWVLREYASARPSSLLSVDSNSPTYSIAHGDIRLPEIADVPYLDVVAATASDPSRILLFCLNRHLSRAQSAIIDLSSLGMQNATAKITTLTADNMLAENDETEPNRVAPVSRMETIQNASLHYSFPNASVTVIELQEFPGQSK